MSTTQEKREAIEHSLKIVRKKLGILETKQSQQTITTLELAELTACRKCLRLGKELLDGR